MENLTPVKMIKRLLLKIVLCQAIMLTACIKLQEKQIKLDINCPKCAKFLVDTLYTMSGVHYVSYNKTDSSLIVKYDTTGFSMRRINNFLISNGYIRMSQDSIKTIPACCK